MISSISSSDNKRNIILACAGGAAWGGKEVYNTRKELLNTKNTYKFWLKSVIGSKESDLKREKLYESILSHARNIDKMVPGKNYEQKELLNINKLKKSRKEFLIENKNCFKKQIQDTKKYAPLKIFAKTIGGAAIGLGISYCISYINKRLQK